MPECLNPTCRKPHHIWTSQYRSQLQCPTDVPLFSLKLRNQVMLKTWKSQQAANQLQLQWVSPFEMLLTTHSSARYQSPSRSKNGFRLGLQSPLCPASPLPYSVSLASLKVPPKSSSTRKHL
ncbi:SOCS2-AS1 isoform 3 [Pan troglodytes]|uniref:SOCS2-AS1 isoform 3 n=1 Tax=Pan troglodytes TaxID=9598 RepID=A0A2J8KVH4_PANTR|nr:SOCS2-AS1 isoform 3 [Pan troglodytes]